MHSMIYQKKRAKLLTVGILTLLICSKVSAFDQFGSAAYFNGPSVINVTDTTAEVSLSSAVLSHMTDEEKAGIYFEYSKTNQLCIAIYPVPESCLPKKTGVGKTSAQLTSLMPKTSYMVSYKFDNTIRCIKAPCPTNDLQSLTVEFKTKAAKGGEVLVPTITKYLVIGSRGSQVIVLQNFLYKEGYLSTPATGYYGRLTFQAVKKFQSAHNISATGTVGPTTRALLATTTSTTAPDVATATFEGVVTAYSTGCYSDGECSITVDDKKVITATGRLQQPLGEVRITPELGGYEKTVGAHANVYARELANEFTLYGSHDYYLEISLPIKGKLPAGSVPSGDVSTLKGIAWLWQKTTPSDSAVITPRRDMFTVTLTSDGKVSGTTDCNNFFGSYKLASDGRISFGDISSTKMYCEGSQESEFVSALAKGGRAILGGNSTLQVMQGDGSILYFTKK
jgi:heat shock protein HslJ/peptidoglycan hydrolase-like protein with peptidoglycan-binding domain